ncbi:MAG: hypothetical protein IPN17_36805 [Deltaproteobacteria bacterium]|nr:hypothetical protein [Deltaproteobacteria bacterium]
MNTAPPPRAKGAAKTKGMAMHAVLDPRHAGSDVAEGPEAARSARATVKAHPGPAGAVRGAPVRPPVPARPSVLEPMLRLDALPGPPDRSMVPSMTTSPETWRSSVADDAAVPLVSSITTTPAEYEPM